MATIRTKRGVKANLPSSAPSGELLITTDTHELHVGTNANVVRVVVDAANVINAGQPDTLATLDANGKVPGTQMPAGATFTPVPHRANPADNDTARQAWLVQLRADMISVGMMTPPALYVISGVISGATISDVTLTLKRIGYADQTIDSDGGGAYTFNNVEEGGLYTIEASKSGYTFTPTSITINNLTANAVNQNFTAAEATVSTMSGTSLIVPRNSASRASVLDIAARTFSNPTSLSSLTQNIYPSTYYQGRFFVPIPASNEIKVYDDAFTLKTTITGSFGTPIRVFTAAGKIVVVGLNSVRFVTYNYTTDAWALGTTLTPTGTITDSTSNGLKIWCPTNGGVSRFYEIDIAAETGVMRNMGTNIGQIANVEYGNNTLFVSVGTVGRIINATTLADIATVSLANAVTSHRIAYANGQFWMGVTGTGFVRVNETTGAVTNISATFVPNGVVTNGTLLFAANQGVELRVYNASDATQNGSTLTLNTGWFPKN